MMLCDSRPGRLSPLSPTPTLRLNRLTHRASTRAGATGRIVDQLVSVLYRARMYLFGVGLWLLGSLFVLLATVGYAVGEIMGVPGGLTAALVVSGYAIVVDVTALQPLVRRYA